jgi:hypothetical protein
MAAARLRQSPLRQICCVPTHRRLPGRIEVDGKWPRVHLPLLLADVEWHTVSMELINTTRYSERFIVYQHVVAFRVTNDHSCVTWQDSLRSAHPLRRRRQVALEAHQWRQTLRLLDALTGKYTPHINTNTQTHRHTHTCAHTHTHTVFPPLGADWQPRVTSPDSGFRWICSDFSGFCHKNYHDKHDAPLIALLSGPPRTSNASAHQPNHMPSKQGGAAKASAGGETWEAYAARVR